MPKKKQKSSRSPIIKMIDWQRYSQLLTDGSDAALRRFFAERPGVDIAAIGYTFELWNSSPAFNLCANTRTYFHEVKERYRKEWPSTPEDQIRWSSGDFQFCSGLLNTADELGSEWKAEYSRLHDLANQDPDSREVYDGLVRISCNALAKLAKRGLFGNWKEIDFNVAEYGDDVEVVKQRDRKIRALIEKDNETSR